MISILMIMISLKIKLINYIKIKTKIKGFTIKTLINYFYRYHHLIGLKLLINFLLLYQIK